MSRLYNILNKIVEDTGWVSLNPYIASGFAARDTGTYLPCYRIKSGVVYFKGEVYSTTAKNQKRADLLVELPEAIAPADVVQIFGGGMRYYGTPFMIYSYFDSDVRTISVFDEANIGVQNSTSGYSLANLTPYVVKK